MSWLWIPILIIWAIAAVSGYRRGFVEIIVRFILSIVLLLILCPIIESVLQENTPILECAENAFINSLSPHLGSGEIDRNSQVSFINSLPLLEYVKRDIIENNNSIIYEFFSAGTFLEYIASYFASAVLKVIAFFIALIASDIIVKIVVDVLNVFADLPIIGVFNHIGGAAIGIGKGVVYLWIFFVIVSLLAKTTLGASLVNEISKDTYLNYLYENNMLIQYIVFLVTR